METLRKHVETWAATGTPEGQAALMELDRLERSESDDVLEFMVKFGHVFTTGDGTPLHLHPPTNHPRWLTTRLAIERAEKMEEETGEFRQAVHTQDLAGMADALVDLVYFAKGTAAMMGLPWAELWADVQRANMEKERGEKVRQGRLHKVDAVKPPGWRPPQTMAVLMTAGYVPEHHAGVSWDHVEHSPGGEVEFVPRPDYQEQTEPTAKKEYRPPVVRSEPRDDAAYPCGCDPYSPSPACQAEGLWHGQVERTDLRTEGADKS